MKVLFVFAVIAFAMVQAAPSGWGGWNGWNGAWGGHGWAGHGAAAVIGPAAGSAVVAGPSGVITSHHGHSSIVSAGPAVGVLGWNGGHGHWW